MRRSEALQGVRVMRFLEILGRYEAAEFNQLEAAELTMASRQLAAFEFDPLVSAVSAPSDATSFIMQRV